MEQARYWMWTKQTSNNHHQSIQTSSKNSSYYDSWEEQAFAEDAAASGSLGGCIWPPRSYSCSFCRREFRSAQALGGHMNVHRRDRARLKQSPTTPPHNENPNPQNQILRYQYTNLDRNPAFFHQSTSLPSSRFRAPTIQEKSTKQMISESSFDQENPRMSSPFWSKLVSERNQYITDILPEEDIISSEPGGLRGKDGCIKTDLSAFIMPDNLEKAAGCKRRRTDESQVSLDGMNIHVQSQLLELCPSSPEDLDLELRLGDRPAA